MLIFIDNFSRKVWVYFLRQKNEASFIFKKFKVLVENQNGRKIKKRRIDNDLELCGIDFNEFCVVNSISR